MSIFTRDQARDLMRRRHLPEAAIERALDQEFGEFGVAAFKLPVGVDEAALEKTIEHEGDRLMLAHGFEVVRFSHPGRTKQTPGIPNRRYYHRAKRVALWWEAKSATGKQRPDQKLFQEMVEACGETYLLGTYGVLLRWLTLNLAREIRVGATEE